MIEKTNRQIKGQSQARRSWIGKNEREREREREREGERENEKEKRKRGRERSEMNEKRGSDGASS